MLDFHNEYVTMPDWLMKNENYTPLSDKDSFINKSIFSLLKVLTKIRMQSSYAEERNLVNVNFRVFFTFALIVLLSLSRNPVFVLIVITYLLLVCAFMPTIKMIQILRFSILAALFACIILLPAYLGGNAYSFIMIPSKVFATVMAVSILSSSARWDSIISELKRFYLPNILIFVLDITIKYIVMLGEFSLNMLYALKLRSVGKNRSKYSSLSGVAGTMFLKSREMSEEMYCAMECRGFTGEYHVYKKFNIRLADFFYILINVGIVFSFIIFG
ncbi:MAG: energy-coupling factor transporter transmembrane protein EcfT [Clostridiales bacterium]|nr:energy-coupling factor transporter transmembrane protein EcfT [Clostridiales bacterium]